MAHCPCTRFTTWRILASHDLITFTKAEAFGHRLPTSDISKASRLGTSTPAKARKGKYLDRYKDHVRGSSSTSCARPLVAGGENSNFVKCLGVRMDCGKWKGTYAMEIYR